MEFILNLNSSWLYCLLLLALVCFSFFGLFRLALAALAACAFRSIATQVLPLCWLIFRIFSHLFGFLSHDGFFYRFFSIFHRFRMDFGRVSGGFFDVFSHLLLKTRFYKKTAFCLDKTNKIKGSRLDFFIKNRSKIHENTMQI